MTLSKKEFRELLGLYDAIYGYECYGTRDLMLMEHLEDKASDAQYNKAQRIRFGSKERY